MPKLAGHARLLAALCTLLVGACATTGARSAANTSTSARPSTPSASAPQVVPPNTLYTAEEALRDVMAEPLEYMTTGPWPGNQRIFACAFRNRRVIVVNAFCTPSDKPAFRVDVYSPTRGRVRIYAEANGAVSGLTRPRYFTFTVESEFPPPSGKGIPQFTLGMPFEALRFYEEQRYNAFLPACYAGTEHHGERHGCLGELAPRAAQFAAQEHSFLEVANSDWYRTVHQMREFAQRYGREPNE